MFSLMARDNYSNKSSKLWSWQLWTQFKQLSREAWKSQDFNGVWTRDLAIPVRRSNRLSYEATDVGSWSFVSSNEPVKNGCEVIYEMFHILNCGFEISNPQFKSVWNISYITSYSNKSVQLFLDGGSRVFSSLCFDGCVFQ